MRHRSGKFCLVELDRGFSYAVAKFLYNWYAWIPAPASGNTWRVCNAGNLIPWRCRYPHICNSKKLNGQFTCRIFKIRNFRIVGVNIRYENISAYFSICLMRWLLSHRPARERKPHLVQKSSMGSTHKSNVHTHTHRVPSNLTYGKFLSTDWPFIEVLPISFQHWSDFVIQSLHHNK